jgi:predicted RNA methylase
VLVHLGSSNYLERYQIYVNHVQEWRAQFSHVDSVSLRYEGQIIMNPPIGLPHAKRADKIMLEMVTEKKSVPAYLARAAYLRGRGRAETAEYKIERRAPLAESVQIGTTG